MITSTDFWALSTHIIKLVKSNSSIAASAAILGDEHLHNTVVRKAATVAIAWSLVAEKNALEIALFNVWDTSFYTWFKLISRPHIEVMEDIIQGCGNTRLLFNHSLPKLSEISAVLFAHSQWYIKFIVFIFLPPISASFICLFPCFQDPIWMPLTFVQSSNVCLTALTNTVHILYDIIIIRKYFSRLVINLAHRHDNIL